MGEHDAHSCVAIWTECRGTDTLLAEVPYFPPMPTRCGIDHSEPRLTSTETHPQYELFRSSFTAGPELGIRCNKDEFAIWKPRPSRFGVVRGSRRAHCRNDGVRFCGTKDYVFPIGDCDLSRLAVSGLGEVLMGIISRGFLGKRAAADVKLPPGQYLTTDFPVLSAGPTPHIPLEKWEFTIDDGTKILRRWDWQSFRDLPTENITVDLHCVTRWSKLGTHWEGVSLDTILGEIESDADYAMVRSYGDYTTNLPLADLRNKQAWIAFRFDEEDLAPEHGGPARLLVPHLYLWKSAKWVRSIRLMHEDQPGFWESLGYHIYGDPWREQRYSGDE